MSLTDSISKNEKSPIFEDIRFLVDSFDSQRTIDQIMPIFYEEQPITWEIYKSQLTSFINSKIKEGKPVNILDVGCGSGFWALLLKKKFPKCEVWGIDKNIKAVERAFKNSLLNGIDVYLKWGEYLDDKFTENFFDLIILTPPYHLYTELMEDSIPWFARGGEEGLKEFESQAFVAYKHLKDDGLILFNQMSLGNDKEPKLIPILSNIFKQNGFLDLNYILEPFNTELFLKGVYKDTDHYFSLTERYKTLNKLYYTSGIIYKTPEDFRVSISSLEEANRKALGGWERRIDLHKSINDFSENILSDFLYKKDSISGNLREAIQDNDTRSFENSGSNEIVDFLLWEFSKSGFQKENFSFFIDYSSVISCLDQKSNFKLSDFVVKVENKKENYFNENFDESYLQIYDKLKKDSKGIYYHKDFFYKTQSAKFYISTQSNNINDEYITSISNHELDKKQGQLKFNEYNVDYGIFSQYNIEFCNFSFPLTWNNFKYNIDRTEVDDDVQDRCNLLHKAYDSFLKKDINKKSLLLCIPLLGYSNSATNNFEGYGAVFVYLISDNIEYNYTYLATNISQIIRKYTYGYLFEVGKDIAKNAIAQATKSAKAAIMSRNMSHNLGSHVMSHLKMKLSSVQEIIHQRSLKNLISTVNISEIHEQIKNFQDINKIELPFLVGLGRFINYLQERQDYIATISTNYIPFKSTVNFKDFIYDELKPELRFKRHKKEGDDGFNGRQAENLLLDYIAESEGFKGSNYIDLWFGKFRGGEDDDQTDFQRLRNLEIAIPGGITGRQAFFSIIENIIRNAAKHSIKEEINKMAVIINIIEDDNLLMELGEQYLHNKDNYYIFTINSNLENFTTDFEIIEKGLKSPYVEEDGKMNENFKGIKEMRISAAWLRGYAIDTDIDLSKKPPALNCRIIEANNKKCKFQYIICVPKPQKVILVLDNDNSVNYSVLKKELNKHFWDICTEREFKNKFKDYEMVVVEKESVKEKILPYSPPRITLKLLYDEIKSNYSANTLKQKQIEIYQNWIEDILGNDLPQILILDEKVNSENQIPGDVIIQKNKDDGENFFGKIVFSNHYTGTKNKISKSIEAETNISKRMKARFIEGITGNNSTDRIIRKTTWDKLAYYRNLSSSLAKVAIFDERIFNYISPKVKDVIISFENLVKNIDVDNLLEKMAIIYQRIQEYTDDEYLARELSNEIELAYDKGFKSNEEIEIILGKINFEKVNYNYRTENTQSYYEKRIWAFDLEFPPKKEPFIIPDIKIIGYNALIDNTLSFSEDYRVEPIGSIKNSSSNKYKIELDILKNEGFDFILIHQGMLDKIYNHFNIKNNEVNEKTENYKTLFTKDFYNSIIAKKYMTKAEGQYLPRLVIHSGRSKPSKEDMPQKQTFIQFSSIENAVKDCKYTLMELLYSAHYEENSINS